MRIKITHHTIKTGGLFSTTLYEVHARVDFTHEERQIIRQRRSAVEMDGRTRLARSGFYAMLERLRPGGPTFGPAQARPKSAP